MANLSEQLPKLDVVKEKVVGVGGGQLPSFLPFIGGKRLPFPFGGGVSDYTQGQLIAAGLICALLLIALLEVGQRYILPLFYKKTPGELIRSKLSKKQRKHRPSITPTGGAGADSDSSIAKRPSKVKARR